MAKTKKLNESTFAKLVKEINAVGELIRTHQDEKQAVLNGYDRERARFKKGKISKKALMSSIKKSNKELIRLDKNIKKDISRVKTIEKNSKKLISNQAPKPFRATVSGIRMLKIGRRKSSKKKKK